MSALSIVTFGTSPSSIRRRSVAAFADEGGEFLSDVFALREYDPSRALALDGGELRFAHP